MNDRIRQLAEQATTRIEPTATSGEGWIFDKEKFAELIIREVIYDCMNSVRGENVIRISMVAKHWGVEV